jgi:hypothetical protein
MTIKQQGGIFGRNPTFNNVDVEGTLTVNGEPISDFGTMATQDASSVAITGGAIDGTTVGATSKTTGAFTTIVGDSATSGYISTLQNTLASAAGNGLYVQTRYNTATNIVAKFTTNTGASDVLTLTGDRNMTLHAGNLIIGTSGKGIDFSATSGTGTSELFDDYEEGTWTPAQGSGLTVVGSFSSSGTYTKIGRQVTVTFKVAGSTSIAVSAGGIITNNLPFTVLSGINAAGTINRFGAAGGECIGANAGVLVYNGAAISAGGGLDISISYFV